MKMAHTRVRRRGVDAVGSKTKSITDLRHMDLREELGRLLLVSMEMVGLETLRRDRDPLRVIQRSV